MLSYSRVVIVMAGIEEGKVRTVRTFCCIHTKHAIRMFLERGAGERMHREERPPHRKGDTKDLATLEKTFSLGTPNVTWWSH